MAESMKTGPVLPWGHRDQAEDEEAKRASETTSSNPGLSLPGVGLELNDRIEVKWTLEKDDGPPAEKWWGARVVEDKSENGNGEFGVRYDAFEDFEEVDATVRFVSKRTLIDVEEDAEMVWRKEGELDGDTTEAEMEEGAFTIVEMLDELGGDEPRSEGSVMDMLNSEEIRGMPVSVQMKLANGLQQLKSSFQEMLANVTEEKGPNAIIEYEDVEKMMQRLKDNARSHK